MARDRGKMSQQLKIQMARELGIAQAVKSGYFGEVSSRDCGALVRQAIEHAQRILVNQTNR